MRIVAVSENNDKEDVIDPYYSWEKIPGTVANRCEEMT